MFRASIFCNPLFFFFSRPGFLAIAPGSGDARADDVADDGSGMGIAGGVGWLVGTWASEGEARAVGVSERELRADDEKLEGVGSIWSLKLSPPLGDAAADVAAVAAARAAVAASASLALARVLLAEGNSLSLARVLPRSKRRSPQTRHIFLTALNGFFFAGRPPPPFVFFLSVPRPTASEEVQPGTSSAPHAGQQMGSVAAWGRAARSRRRERWSAASDGESGWRIEGRARRWARLVGWVMRGAGVGADWAAMATGLEGMSREVVAEVTRTDRTRFQLEQTPGPQVVRHERAEVGETQLPRAMLEKTKKSGMKVELV